MCGGAEFGNTHALIKKVSENRDGDSGGLWFKQFFMVYDDDYTALCGLLIETVLWDSHEHKTLLDESKQFDEIHMNTQPY